jgi:hypothetical protein
MSGKNYGKENNHRNCAGYLVSPRNHFTILHTLTMKHKPILSELAEKYKQPQKRFIHRLDGRIEWICEHGVGHTVWYPEYSDDIHGCCSGNCCGKLKVTQTWPI